MEVEEDGVQMQMQPSCTYVGLQVGKLMMCAYLGLANLGRELHLAPWRRARQARPAKPRQARPDPIHLHLPRPLLLLLRP